MGVLSKDPETILVMYKKATIRRRKLNIQPYARKSSCGRIIIYPVSIIFMVYTIYKSFMILSFPGWLGSGNLLVREVLWGLLINFPIIISSGGRQFLSTKGLSFKGTKRNYHSIYAEYSSRLRRNFDDPRQHNWLNITAILPCLWSTVAQQEAWRAQADLDSKVEFAAYLAKLGSCWWKEELTSKFSRVSNPFWHLVQLWIFIILLMFSLGVITEYESCRKFDYIYNTWHFISFRIMVLLLWTFLLSKFGQQFMWRMELEVEADEIRKLCIKQSRKHGKSGKNLFCGWIEDFLVPADSDTVFRQEMETVVASILKEVYWEEIRSWVDDGCSLPGNLHSHHRLAEKVSSSSPELRNKSRRRTYS